jgi:hypothetical protein
MAFRTYNLTLEAWLNTMVSVLMLRRTRASRHTERELQSKEGDAEFTVNIWVQCLSVACFVNL